MIEVSRRLLEIARHHCNPGPAAKGLAHVRARRSPAAGKLMSLAASGCVFLLLGSAAYSQSSVLGDMPPIAGWSDSVSGGAHHFRPERTDGVAEYDVMPLEQANAVDLGAWVRDKARADIRDSGWSIEEGASGETLNAGVYGYRLTVGRPGGQQFAAVYVGYALPDGHVRWARILSPTTGTDDILRAALTHFIGLYKEEGQGSAERPEPADKARSEAEIAGVFLHRETSSGMGGIAISVQRPYLFLKDGTFYGWLDEDPSRIVGSSLAANPKKWGTWQIHGNAISLRWNASGNTEEWSPSWWQRAVPASPGDRLSGSFSSISGGGNTVMGGGSFAMSSKYMTFDREGRFTFESVGGGGYSGNGGSNSAWSSHDSAGTYALDGYSITLTFNNGKELKSAFYFYDDDKNMFGINTSIYTPDD